MSVVSRQTGTRFECTDCEYTTSTKQILGRHITAVHLQLKEFQCTNCYATFGFYSTWTNHQKQCNYSNRTKETEEGQLYKCDECLSPFVRRHDMPEHFFRYHCKQQQMWCDPCDKMFWSRKGLDEHNVRDHVTIAYVCASCTLNFKGWYQMKWHERTVHRRRNFTPRTRFDPKKRDNLVCDHCDNIFLIGASGSLPPSKGTAFAKRGLRRDTFHMHVLACQAAYKCPIFDCGSRFETQTFLRHHRESVHGTGETVVCDDCNACFTSPFEYQNHMLSQHHNMQQNVTSNVDENIISDHFICDQCDKRFIQSNLLLHHTVNDSFSCPLCDWQTNHTGFCANVNKAEKRRNERSLRRHCKILHGLQRKKLWYICDQCSGKRSTKAFVRTCALIHLLREKRAMKKHTGAICVMLPIKTEVAHF